MIAEFILDLILPNRCPLCGKVIEWNKKYCQECLDDLPETGKEFCRKCGNNNIYCVCRKRKALFSRCYAAYYYDDTAQSAVIYLKETKNMIFPHIVAEKLYKDMQNDDYKFKADFIVPVPMSKRKKRVRGYNQAALLGKELSDIMGVAMQEDILKRHDTLRAQHTMSKKERMASVKGKYYANPDVDIKGKTVIVCDDVMTTGSTINECARVLLDMGAAQVIAVAAAVTKQ